MISAISLLDRTNTAGLEHVDKLQGVDDVFGFLQHGFQSLKNNEPDFIGNSYLDEYTTNLSNTIEDDIISMSDGSSITDSVDLNILIERSLLEYELKFNSNNEQNKKILNYESLKESLGQITDSKLLRHYVELMKLGYISELDISTNDKSKSDVNDNERLVGELLSILLTIAVQKNINLPEFDERGMTNMDTRMKWFKECIYKIADNNGNKSTTPITDNKNDNNSNKNKTETALNDLQFAHNYLTKKYEEEMSHHVKYANLMTSKYEKCEELLKKSNDELARCTNELLKAESKNVEYEKRIDMMNKEMHKLQLQNNLFKVDYLGLLPVSTLMSPPNSAANPSIFPESPKTNCSSIPSTPSSPVSPVSVSILRAEFRKLMEQMQKKHEKELQEAYSNK